MARTRIFILSLAVLILTASYAVAGGMHKGVVLETLDGGGYTYLKVEENGKAFWLAGPKIQVAAGATVTFDEQMWMTNFKSKALDRTFESLLFVSNIRVVSSETQAPAATSDPHTSFGIPIKVEGTFTVAEIFEKKDDLDGKYVRVKGDVVKVSKRILGRNWVHVQDETGKVIFTTKSDTVAVGDAVVAQGVLTADKDFGAGYFYDVIIEAATFTK